MSVRQIIFSEDPLLRSKSRPVRRGGSALDELIADMVETMHEADGIGLAAIQIGVPRRVIVVQVPKPPEEEKLEEEAATEKQPFEPGELYVVVNPELAHTSREMEEGIEGCLSVPGWVGEVSRHQSVTIKGVAPGGKPVRIEAKGLLARVFQHEIDHCDGILFIDHIEDSEKIWPVAEGEEEAAEAAQEIPGRQAGSELLV